MARSSLTLDLKAHTGRALNEFKAFSDSLEKKFFVSGLKIDLLKNTLSEINREFDRAMGSEGMRSATELKQLETSSAAVFSVLKGGSLEAGREMAKNIRVALGDVSKSIGSTTEDINSVLRMVPYTSKALLDSAGVSMEEFHTENLRMITNVRDAMGEDASKIIEGLLSGETTNTDLLNDKTGIGQLIRTQIGAFDPSAMSPEARTEKVLQILQNDEFQNMIEGLAEDNAGFMRVVRRFRNTLFDPRTGVFGILKESTLSLREFSGERVTQTTSIFEETTRLFRVIFDPNDGMFARIFKTFGEVFGFNEQNFSDMLIRLIRWVTNVLYNVSQFFSGADFKTFVEGLKGIINFFVTGAQKLSGLFGLTPGGVGTIISNFVGGVGQILKSISEGDWAGAASNISSGISSAAQNVTSGVKNISSGSGGGGINTGGAVLGGLVGTAIAPGLGTAIGAGVGATLDNQTIINITNGAKDIVVNVINGAVEAIGTAVENAGGWEQIGQDTAEIINNIGVSLTEGINNISETLSSGNFDTSGFMEAAKQIFTAIFTQGLKIVDTGLDALIKLKDSFGKDAFRDLGETLGKMALAMLPVVAKGMGIVFDIISEVLSGFISELLTYINPVAWVTNIISGILRALGFEDAADKVDEIRDIMNDFLGEVIAKILLIFNPGGIITKILKFIPIIGGPMAKFFDGLMGIGKFLDDFGAFFIKNIEKIDKLKGLAADAAKNLDDMVRLGMSTTDEIVKAAAKVYKLNKAVGDAVKNLPSSVKVVQAIFNGISKIFTVPANAIAGVLSKIPGVKGILTGIVTQFTKAFPDAIKGLFRSILSRVPVVGTAIDFAINKASGESNTRAMTKAVVSNIVGGVLAAIALPTGPLGMAAAAIVGGIGADWVTGKVLDMMGVKFNGNIPEHARASNGLNMLAAAASREQENIRPGAKPVIANSDEIIIPPGRLAEVRFIAKDQVNDSLDARLPQLGDKISDSIHRDLTRYSDMMGIMLSGQRDSGVSGLLKENIPSTEDIGRMIDQKLMGNAAVTTPGAPSPNNLASFQAGFNKSLGLLGETLDEYGEESEDSWLKSLDSASTFFSELDYKTSVEWKNAISKPLQVSTPSVQVDTSEIETSIKSGVEGINFGDIFSKVPEGLTSGWDNLVNFFEEAGKKAKEFLSGREDGKWRWPWENPNNYNGNRLNTANTGFNLAGFTAAAQEEVLNSGFSSNIVVANDTEIIAPKSSLNQLASLLLRQSGVGRSGAPAPVSNENHIVFNINGATDPDAVAAAVMQKMDLALSHTMMNNRVPHA